MARQERQPARAWQAAALAVVVGLAVASCSGQEERRAERVPASDPASTGTPSSRAPTTPAASRASGDWRPLPGPPRPVRGLQYLVPVMAAGQVVVMAGVDHDQATMKAIAFDADSRRWSRTAPSQVWWRYGYTAVGVGTQVIVWGGCCGGGGDGSRAPGVRYDVAQDRWHPLVRTGFGTRNYHTAVWTGEEMLVWGGFAGHSGRPRQLRASGAAFDPEAETWRRISPAPLAPRKDHVAVWTGEEMVLWGGSRPLRPLRRQEERLFYDGAAYNVERDSWRRLPSTRLLSAGVPVLPAGAEPDLNAVWTGDTMLIWGPNGGAGYDPDTDQWERVPDPPFRFNVEYDGSTAVWTGDELIVWGGVFGGDDFSSAGAAYDPERRRWRSLPEAPISGRVGHGAVWTGEGMIVWGGCCGDRGQDAEGAIYSP